MKKLLAVVVAVVLATAVFAADSAVENAVKEAAPGIELAVTQLTLTDEQVAMVQEKMGSKAPVNKAYTVYKGKDAAVVIEEQKGKWGLIKMAILIDTAAGKMKNIAYISMSEKRGAGIKAGTFYKQFVDKGLGDDLEVGKGIRGVSGATISSKAVAIAVKRALIVAGIAAGPGKAAGKK